MPTLPKRQLQLARIIQEVLHTILLKENLYAQHGALASIRDIEVAPNFRQVRIALSVYPKEAQAEWYVTFQAREHEIIKQLNISLRYQFVRLPKFSFHIDDTLSKAEKIYEILDNL